jgi:CheY-like chemotaxis protein
MAIRDKRSELGISQEELASRSGLHRTYISDIERGARNPSLESLQRLAKALEVSLPGLFEKAGDTNCEREIVEILLAAGDPEDIKLTERAFKEARIRNPVYTVRTGVEALDFIFATGPHAERRSDCHRLVILLDLNLRKIDGLEVLRRIKADKRTREIPVVVLTVSNRDSDIAECRRLGADGAIVKPLGFQTFSETMPGLHFDWALLKSRGQRPRGGLTEGAS